MKNLRFLLPFSLYSKAYGDGSVRRTMSSSGCGARLVIAGLIAAFVLFQYFMKPHEVNHFTGRGQRLDLDPQSEIQMGLASAPQMARQYGGLSPDARAREIVSLVGKKIVTGTDAQKTPYKFNFHLLADHNVVNAFALPGGQIFITEALYRMLGTEDEVAGVLAHEVGHVVGRHSSEQIAKSSLFNGITQAVIVAASGDQHGQEAARVAQMVNQFVTLKYGRSDEIEADKLGVRFLMQCGYSPEAMISVMEVLKKAAGGSKGQPEFMSTHPDPENRIGRIKEEIERLRSGSSLGRGTG
jgi:predicted Zn-dependent protease